MPTPLISLPLSGGHWMVTPTLSATPAPSMPRPAEKCVGCGEVIANFTLAQATGDEFGIILARARIMRHFGAAHRAIEEWPGEDGQERAMHPNE